MPEPGNAPGVSPEGPGRRIHRLRQQLGLSQEQLAGPELSASYVSRIESGSRQPTQRILELLAPRLKTSVDHLLSGVDADVVERLQLEVQAAAFSLQGGDALRSEEILRAVEDQARSSGRADIPLDVSAGLARALEAQGRLEDAAEVWEQLLAAASVAGLVWFEAAIAVVRVYRLVGDLRRSTELGDRLVGQIEAAGLEQTPEGVRLLLTLVGSYHERGDTVYAARLARTALARAEGSKDRRAIASAYWNTSLVLSNRGEYAEALRLGERAVAIFSEGDNPRDLAQVRIAYAKLLIRTGEATQAWALLVKARAVLDVVGSQTDVALCVLEQARAGLGLGNAEVAHGFAQEALALLGPGPRILTAEAYLLRGRAHVGLGEMPQAHGAFRAAALTLAGMEAGRLAARAWAELGDSLDAAGDTAASRDAYRAAAACAGIIGTAESIAAAATAITEALA